MTAGTTVRAGDTGRPWRTGSTPARRLRTVAGLARAEASLLLRSTLVLAGLLAGGLAVWGLTRSAVPLWWNAAWQTGEGQVILAATVLVAAHLATGRSRRDGLRELYDSFPVSAATRTLAQLAALAGAVPASLLLIGAAIAWVQSRGAIGTPSAAVLAGGVLLVIAAGAAGVALGTRLPHPMAGILAALVLFVLFTQSYRLLAYPAAGGLPWLFPWTMPNQLGSLPGPLTGYPPGGAHAVELAGAAILAALVALALASSRARHRIWLAAALIVPVAVIGASSAVQLRPIPTSDLNRLISEASAPSSVQHCSTASQVRYCLYPGFGSQLPVLKAPVDAVLAKLPARPARALTVAQAASLFVDDPPLFHGHTGQQLTRWKAELRAAPDNAAATSAIYLTVGSWPAGAGLAGARFGLALGAAEWAVHLPPSAASTSNFTAACVPLGQAREAIAIWLAITATHAPAAELLPHGDDLTGAAQVRGRQVALWVYPGQNASYFAATGPQLTAAGYLLASRMTALPAGKVMRVLDAAWPTWLNPHTTEARLAAALGVPMPSGPSLPSPPPGSNLPTVHLPPSPVCTG